MKHNKTDPVGNLRKFDESLRAGAGIDPELQQVMDRWEGLSRELRAVIVRMIG